MENKLKFNSKKKVKILSLGAESVGRFSVYENGRIFISENYGDILIEDNFKKYSKAVQNQIKSKKLDAVITDLHPGYNSTMLGETLSRKLNVPHIFVQHHIAHIFSSAGDYVLENNSFPGRFIGIASDGTGYGFDENIWGGEIFKFEINKTKNKTFPQAQNNKTKRIGTLENQIMIGGDLAVKEPARMLIGILNKFLAKEKIYEYIKKYYSKNEFELLHSQLEQNFNCQKTSSTGRILDAVSVLLCFAKNERKSKHEATMLLEKYSSNAYELAPVISYIEKDDIHVLKTTPLFEFIINNIGKDKNRLAATAQEYIARGFWEITRKDSENKNVQIFFAGGMANNKIISSYLEKRGVYISKKIPSGDEGIAFGQIMFYLYAN